MMQVIRWYRTVYSMMLEIRTRTVPTVNHVVESRWRVVCRCTWGDVISHLARVDRSGVASAPFLGTLIRIVDSKFTPVSPFPIFARPISSSIH